MVRVIKVGLIGKGLRRISIMKRCLWTCEGVGGLDPGTRLPFCVTEQHKLRMAGETSHPSHWVLKWGPKRRRQGIYAQDQCETEIPIDFWSKQGENYLPENPGCSKQCENIKTRPRFWQRKCDKGNPGLVGSFGAPVRRDKSTFVSLWIYFSLEAELYFDGWFEGKLRYCH